MGLKMVHNNVQCNPLVALLADYMTLSPKIRMHWNCAVISDGPDVNVTVTGTGTSCNPNSENFFCTTTLGVDVTIMCTVFANPAATLRVVAAEQDNVQVMNDGSSQARITVDSLTMENLGIYQCIANNNMTEQAIDIQLSLFGMYVYKLCLCYW